MNKLPGLLISTFLLLAMMTFLATDAVPPSYNYEWDDSIYENVTLVYEIESLNYNGTNEVMMTNEFDEEIGYLRQGDLLMFQIEKLSDVTDDTSNVTVWLSSTSMWEGTEMEYAPLMTPDWYYDTDGPNMMYVAIPIPVDPADWTSIESDWDGAGDGNITALYDDPTNIFNLTAAGNVADNNTAFTSSWNTENGVLDFYTYSSDDGPEDLPISFFMRFQYFRDEAQWDMSWGIDEGDMAAWTYDELSWDNGSGPYDWMPAWNGDNGGGSAAENGDDDNILEEGNLVVFMFHELWEYADDTPPNYNVSMMTVNFDMSMEMSFDHIGENPEGPGWGYPLMLIGNDNFYGNITDEINQMENTTLTIDDVNKNLMNITVDNTDYYERVSWDLTTGLMQYIYYDGPGPENGTLLMEASFTYFLPTSTADYLVSDGFSQRYILTEMKNGTDDFITVGGDNESLTLYDGDLLSMYFDTLSLDEGLDIGMRTSSGGELFIEELHMMPPGLEEAIDGPPLFYPVVPVGGTTWWDDVETAWHAARGCTIVNTTTDFTIGATISVRINDTHTAPIDADVTWSKTDGVLNHFRLNGTIDGNEVIWEMNRGLTINVSEISWSWGISTGDTMTYDFEILNMGGVTYMDEFGVDDVTVNQGDDILLEVTWLANLAGSDQGPAFNCTGYAEGTYEPDIMFGLSEPGFEYAEYLLRDEDDHRPQPWIVPAIPIGDSAYWTLLQDLYEEASYTVVNNGTHFQVSHDFGGGQSFDIVWQKSDGVALYCDTQMVEDGTAWHFRLVLVSTGDTPPDTGTETGDGGAVPGFESYIVVPILAAIALTLRRRRE